MGKNGVKKNSCLLTMNNNESTYFRSKTKYPVAKNGRKITQSFMTIAHFKHKEFSSYPYELDNTMLFLIVQFMIQFIVQFMIINE
uniref:NAD(P)H-quinone oxidoreductase subunit 5, chloroplastic n=1 Tax=Solanum lycopersicum TaxID=4081 RepID=A0A3Q7J6J5_SOLLC